MDSPRRSTVSRLTVSFSYCHEYLFFLCVKASLHFMVFQLAERGISEGRNFMWFLGWANRVYWGLDAKVLLSPVKQGRNITPQASSQPG